MDKDKKDFIWKRGILGVGVPVALMMSVIAGYQVPGYLLKMQAFNYRTFLLALVIFTPVFLIAGFFWGLLVYRLRKNK